MTGPRARRPAAAGTFYPGEPGELARTVDELLAAATPPSGGPPFALIVPHAGYVYSGPVAATAFVMLRSAAGSLGRVAVFGPAHFAPLLGSAVPSADAWTTPLGDVPVDDELRRMVLASGAVGDDGPHVPEHSIEVQLPFLQRLLGPELRVLPVAVGASEPGRVADLMAALRGSSDLLVVSTDLSHYHDDARAKALDRRTADAVVARDPEAIGPEDACGVFALRGVAELARREGLEVRLLDLRTSADTSGDRRRVVGYGAFAVSGAS